MQHSYTPEKVVKYVTLEGVFFFSCKFFVTGPGIKLDIVSVVAFKRAPEGAVKSHLSVVSILAGQCMDQAALHRLLYCKNDNTRPGIITGQIKKHSIKKQPESDPLSCSARNTHAAFLKLPRG
jgi:hypothetical protein